MVCAKKKKNAKQKDNNKQNQKRETSAGRGELFSYSVKIRDHKRINMDIGKQVHQTRWRTAWCCQHNVNSVKAPKRKQLNHNNTYIEYTRAANQ